ncbi:ABC transporter substrate-binding protein [Bradyrhizobium monzae]|uniref:ABC transporter substrate-binding protein n=1 Tax=Bradyrhizobium sp. Oc8 TaxID=2876780 RepID=UPI001F4054B3|nr:ABC transporter substrate-binding protein [Bradyrhizobium sp. Oc8]
MIKRREFFGGLGSLVLLRPRAAIAESGRTFHLGTLTPIAPVTETSPTGEILIKVLAERGFKLGQNLTLEARGALGDVAKLPALVAELKAKGVDAIVIGGYPTAIALKGVGIPTVAAIGIGDPVETHLIESLSHPGGNITGISDVAATLSAKRLSLLKEMSPKLAKVAMLWNEDDLGMTMRYQASAKAAQALGLSVQALGVREPDDFNEAFAAMDGDTPDGILMVADGLTNLNRKRVFDFAAAKKIPAIYEFDFLARDGGLMSYGPDLSESFARAAALVSRIFRGERPGDLPFEQPTRYPLVLNLKTAKAAGLEFPPTLLALADDVIE